MLSKESDCASGSTVAGRHLQPVGGGTEFNSVTSKFYFAHSQRSLGHQVFSDVAKLLIIVSPYFLRGNGSQTVLELIPPIHFSRRLAPFIAVNFFALSSFPASCPRFYYVLDRQ